MGTGYHLAWKLDGSSCGRAPRETNLSDDSCNGQSGCWLPIIVGHVIGIGVRPAGVSRLVLVAALTWLLTRE